MIKAPAKFKKSISCELKKYIPVVQNLVAKGKTSTEEDARIVINDILADVLGYDKYNELKTEFKDKNGRLDYVVKLNEGPLSKKKDRFDFIIEAKASCVDLKEDHVNQAMSYCLQANIDYFILTNAVKWKLFEVNKSKTKNDSRCIWEVDLGKGADNEILADEMYVLSKHAYLEEHWTFISDHSKATDAGDIMAVIMSDKFVKNICKTLKDVHDVKIVEDVIKDTLITKLFKDDFNKLNKRLLTKLNTPDTKPEIKKEEGRAVVTQVVVEECPPPVPGLEKPEAA